MQACFAAYDVRAGAHERAYAHALAPPWNGIGWTARTSHIIPVDTCHTRAFNHTKCIYNANMPHTIRPQNDVHIAHFQLNINLVCLSKITSYLVISCKLCILNKLRFIWILSTIHTELTHTHTPHPHAHKYWHVYTYSYGVGFVVVGGGSMNAVVVIVSFSSHSPHSICVIIVSHFGIVLLSVATINRARWISNEQISIHPSIDRSIDRLNGFQWRLNEQHYKDAQTGLQRYSRICVHTVLSVWQTYTYKYTLLITFSWNFAFFNQFVEFYEQLSSRLPPQKSCTWTRSNSFELFSIEIFNSPDEIGQVRLNLRWDKAHLWAV